MIPVGCSLAEKVWCQSEKTRILTLVDDVSKGCWCGCSNSCVEEAAAFLRFSFHCWISLLIFDEDDSTRGMVSHRSKDCASSTFLQGFEYQALQGSVGQRLPARVRGSAIFSYLIRYEVLTNVSYLTRYEN